MRALIRRHIHFVVVITVLIVVMTFPTIAYVFNTDEFWIPEKTNRDVLIQFWDIWYGKRVLSGQADRYFTDLVFYPEGISLTRYPLFLPYIIVVNAFQLLLPLSNAFSLAYLLIIFSAALSAYLYLYWLLDERWLALFGAVIFGFCPQVIGFPAWPTIAWIAPVPLIVYCAHRGIAEKRTKLVILAGLLAGLTTTVIMYLFVCVAITLGLLVAGFAVSRWRDRVFWRHILLLVLILVLSSAWRLVPMLRELPAPDSEPVPVSNKFYSGDLISFFVNSKHPLLGSLVTAVLQTPDDAPLNKKSYLGLLPLGLIVIGLGSKGTRRKMLPWLALLSVFLVLSLGSALRINGTMFESIKLPKYFLDRLLPFVFASFSRLNFFMTGAWLPLAVLACYGAMSLRERYPAAAKPGFILLLIAIVAFEYFNPIDESVAPTWSKNVAEERLAYVGWLANDENVNAIVNVPFGYNNARIYSFHQTLYDHPQVEGAVSRKPDDAYDYIKSNDLLRAWYSNRPIHCQMTNPADYLANLAQLRDDGFSHVIYHRGLIGSEEIALSFDGIHASYSDESVSIFSLAGLRDSCPAEIDVAQRFTMAFSDALSKSAVLQGRHGSIVVFPPTTEAGDHLTRFLRYFADFEESIYIVSGDEGAAINIQSANLGIVDPAQDLERRNAVWVLNPALDIAAVPSEAGRDWLTDQYRFCERFHQERLSAIDLYLKLDIPCSAVDETNALDVEYDSGVKLHNASYEIVSELVRFYFVWTNAIEDHSGLSLQLFDESNQKVLQYDQLVSRQLLEAHEIDISSLSKGVYEIKLIVYDFETQKSTGGTLAETNERIERELVLGVVSK